MTSPSATTRTRTGTASSPRSMGLINPNHYLAVAIAYLFRFRSELEGRDTAVGKTPGEQQPHRPRGEGARPPRPGRGARGLQVVRGRASSTARWASAARRARAPPSCARDGTVWSTDKDGIDHGPARGGDPGAHRQETRGSTTWSRRAASARRCYHAHRHSRPRPRRSRRSRKALPGGRAPATTLAGEPILQPASTRAPGNNADIGGLKVVTENGWFAARPSGTEATCTKSTRRASGTRSTCSAFWRTHTDPDRQGLAQPAGPGPAPRRARTMTARPVILCVNSGSSFLKFALYQCAAAAKTVLADGAVERIGMPTWP